MRTLLVMNLTGSVLFTLYFLVKRTIGRRLSYAWYYRMLILNMILFLIPLLLLGDIYKTLWFYLKELMGINRVDTMVFTSESKLLFVSEDGLRMSYGLRQYALIIGFYMVGIVATIVAFLVVSRRKRRMFREIVRKDIRITDPVFERIKKSLGIKREVRLLACSKESQIATMFVIRPIVLYCDPSVNRDANTEWSEVLTRYRKEFILTHELYHVKRMDVLWKALAYLVNIVFFANPLTFFLRREFERICELSCDEYVIAGKECDDRRAYAHILIDSSLEEAETVDGIPWVSVSWKKGLINQTKERIEEIVMNNKKRMGRGMAVVIAALVLGLSSITSVAYDEVRYGMPENYDDYTQNNEGNWIVFTPAERALEYKNLDIPIIYDKQIYDEDCNIYSYDEYFSAYDDQNRLCIFHTYKDLSWTEHHVGIGGCDITYYSGKVCTKCGKIKDSKVECVIPYSPCPH